MNENSRLQNTISILVITLLVTQTVLLIFVLLSLKILRQAIETGIVSPSDPSLSLIGQEAPDFTLADENGKPIVLSEYKGQLVLLVFTSHTCPYCREMYPNLLRFIKEQPDIQVMVLAMNTIEENQQFQNEFGFKGYANMHILSTTKEEAEQYRIAGTPTFVVVDADGTIFNIGYAITTEQMSGLIAK